MMRGLAVLVLSAVAAAPMIGCKSPVCGDGAPEEGEACDDGNDIDGDACSNTCQAQPSLDIQVAWTLIGREAGYIGLDVSETCGQVDADEIELAITGPLEMTQRIDCSYQNTPIRSLVAGDYSIVATLYQLAEDGTSIPLSAGNASAAFSLSEDTQCTGDVCTAVSVDLDFGYSDFLLDYTGTYYFEITWDGLETCEAAGVEEHVFLLEQDGAAVSGTTTNGEAIDGSTPATCVSDIKVVRDAPWGPAVIAIQGLDVDGSIQYEGTFDTFLGAGISNDTHVIDVPMASDSSKKWAVR